MPNPLRACNHQVGGHSTEEGAPSSLSDGQGNFYKQLQLGPRGARELCFYAILQPWQQPQQQQPIATPSLHHRDTQQQQQCVQNTCNGEGSHANAEGGCTSASLAPGGAAVEQQLRELAHWVPRSIGLHHHDGHPYLGLEDITAAYVSPCIMDIKVGWHTWYPWAPQELQEKYRRKDAATTQSSCGFRICGVQVRCAADGSLVWREGRDWGKKLQQADLAATFRRFASNEALSAADVFYGKDGNGLLHQLQQLHQVFQRQSLWHFFSASVLLVYEGQATTSAQAKPTLRLIDFAHAFPTAELRAWLDECSDRQQQKVLAAGSAGVPTANSNSSCSATDPLAQQVLAALAAAAATGSQSLSAEQPEQLWLGCTAHGQDENMGSGLQSLIAHIENAIPMAAAAGCTQQLAAAGVT